MRVEEWFLTGAIPNQQRPLIGEIANYKGKHAIEAFAHGSAEFFVKVKQYFGVALSGELMFAMLQLMPQLPVIVDFSVKNYRHTLVFIVHRLMTAAQIND